MPELVQQNYDTLTVCGETVNRTDLQQLAQERIEEAALLLSATKYSGAYYLTGYAIELALKACIAKLTNQHDFYDKEIAKECFTHKPNILVKLAGLRHQLDHDIAKNRHLKVNWATACVWTEASRYEFHTKDEAEALFEAVTNATHGVLPWIRTHW
jgi:HEPN domain-containing protein